VERELGEDRVVGQVAVFHAAGQRQVAPADPHVVDELAVINSRGRWSRYPGRGRRTKKSRRVSVTSAVSGPHAMTKSVRAGLPGAYWMAINSVPVVPFGKLLVDRVEPSSTDARQSDG
jgi:hypothetical protein